MNQNGIIQTTIAMAIFFIVAYIFTYIDMRISWSIVIFAILILILLQSGKPLSFLPYAGKISDYDR